MTRHINFHKIKGLVAFRKVLVEKIHTFKNATDMLAKPTPLTSMRYNLKLSGCERHARNLHRGLIFVMVEIV